MRMGLWAAGLMVLLVGCKGTGPAQSVNPSDALTGGPNWLLGDWKETGDKEGCALELRFTPTDEALVLKNATLSYHVSYSGDPTKIFALTDKGMQGYLALSPKHMQMEYRVCEYDKQ
jgi:hypothetical protein